MADEVTRDPHWEALFDEATKLAREDAKAGRDPQVLTGHLAIMQGEYDDSYSATLVEIANSREGN